MSTTLDYATPPKHQTMIVIWTVLWRLLYGFAGIVLPIICLAVAGMGHMLGPEWQSGAWHDKTIMLVWSSVGWPLYPLCLFAMAGMAVALVSVRWTARVAVCRWGLYSGIPLSMVYMVLLAIAIAKPHDTVWQNFWYVAAVSGAEVLGGTVVSLVLLACWYVTTRWGTLRLWLAVLGGLMLMVALAAGVAALAGGRRGLGEIVGPCIFLPMAGILAGSPGLALAAYGVMAIRVACHENKPWTPYWLRLTAALAWLAALGGAWKIAAALAVTEYAKLPTTDPSCYIGTAAARGHRWLVGAAPVDNVPGGLRINDQVRYCKAFEVILAATCPGLHNALRRLYDTIGPVLARKIQTPWLADLAYLLLKPAEWMARVVVRRAGVESVTRRLYQCVQGEFKTTEG